MSEISRLLTFFSHDMIVRNAVLFCSTFRHAQLLHQLIARLCNAATIVEFFESMERRSRARCDLLLRLVLLECMAHVPDAAVLALINELLIRRGPIKHVS